VSAVIAEVAAAEIMPRFTRLAAGDVREKGPGDLVTVADEAAEAALERRLLAVLPQATILGEEAAAADPRLIGRLMSEAPVWVGDPSAGPSNFAEGKPLFAVMVALVQNGRIVASWIHDPVSGRTAHAAAGEGAWLDGERLGVSRPAGEVAAMRGSLMAGFFGDRELGRRLQARRGRVQVVGSLRCAGHEYIRLARGEMDFALFT